MQLHQRHQWPIIKYSCDKDKNTPRGLCIDSPHRESFRTHYTTARTVRGFKKGVSRLLQLTSWPDVNSSSSSSAMSNAIMQYFNNVPIFNPPETDNCCVGIIPWSDDGTSFLAGFKKDCSLRVFSAASGTSCHEVTNVVAAPQISGKDVEWLLKYINADENFIACLFEDANDDDYDDFEDCYDAIMFLERSCLEVCAACPSDGVGAKDSILSKCCTIQEAFQDFVSLPENKSSVCALHGLDEDDDLGSCHYKVFEMTNKIMPCGAGYFMVEIGLNIGFDNDNVTLERRCLCLISALSGKLTWVGHIPWDDFADMTHIPIAIARSNTNEATVAVEEDYNESIFCLNIKNGKVSPYYILPSSENHPIQYLDCRAGNLMYRSGYLLMFSTDIIRMKTYQEYNGFIPGGVGSGVNSIMAFYPRDCVGEQTIIMLPETFIANAQAMGDNHIFFISITNERGAHTVYGNIIHVPSRKEIEKIELGKNLRPFLESTFTLTASETFMALGFSCFGILSASPAICEIWKTKESYRGNGGNAQRGEISRKRKHMEEAR